MRKFEKLKSRSAFSMVELVITLLIVGILAAVSIPLIKKENDGYRARLAASKIAQDLKFAGSHARASSEPVTIDFFTAATQTFGGYDFQNINHPHRTKETLGVDFDDSAYRVSLDVAPTQVIFDVYGNPDIDGEWVINLGQPTEKTITIDQSSGRVVVQ